MGGALGLALLTSLGTQYTAHLISSDYQPPLMALTNGFRLAFLISAGFAAIGAAIAFRFIPRVRPGRSRPLCRRRRARRSIRFRSPPPPRHRSESAAVSAAAQAPHDATPPPKKNPQPTPPAPAAPRRPPAVVQLSTLRRAALAAGRLLYDSRRHRGGRAGLMGRGRARPACWDSPRWASPSPRAGAPAGGRRRSRWMTKPPSPPRPANPVTVSPLPGTPDASPATQICFLGAAGLRVLSVSARGSRSGSHSGRLARLLDGHRRELPARAIPSSRGSA